MGRKGNFLKIHIDPPVQGTTASRVSTGAVSPAAVYEIHDRFDLYRVRDPIHVSEALRMAVVFLST